MGLRQGRDEHSLLNLVNPSSSHRVIRESSEPELSGQVASKLSSVNKSTSGRLYFTLWNTRGPLTPLDVSDDPSVLFSHQLLTVGI